MTGTIKKIVLDKGFGFILGQDKKEYFFHKSCLKNIKFEDLREDQDVTFEDTEGPKGKGPRAEDIYV